MCWEPSSYKMSAIGRLTKGLRGHLFSSPVFHQSDINSPIRSWMPLICYWLLLLASCPQFTCHPFPSFCFPAPSPSLFLTFCVFLISFSFVCVCVCVHARVCVFILPFIQFFFLLSLVSAKMLQGHAALLNFNGQKKRGGREKIEVKQLWGKSTSVEACGYPSLLLNVIDVLM